MKILISFLLISLLAVSAVTAQDGKQLSNAVEVKANLLILDEKGDYAGVKDSDIKIFEGDIEQKLTSIVQLEGSLDLILVADNTGSMRDQLGDVTRLGKALIANLRATDNAQLIRFVDRAKVEIIEPWTRDKAALTQSLSDGIYVEGGQSAVIDALYLASQDLIKRKSAISNRRSAIVLITDGEDRASYYTEKDLFKLLENQSVQIFTIALTKQLPKNLPSNPENNRKTRGEAVDFVNRLSAVTGGTSYIFQKKSSKEDLQNSVNTLWLELRSQFVINYTSTDVTKNSNVRKLRVTVADGPNGEKRTAFIKDTIVMLPPR